MAPKLYMTEICPCVRAVLLTARALKVTLELEEVDFSNKEHLTSTFLKVSKICTKNEKNNFFLFITAEPSAYCTNFGRQWFRHMG